MTILGDNLRKAREITGLRQEEVAEILQNKYHTKSDRVMISKWETGFQVPKIYAVKCLSEIYGVSMDDLCKGTLKDLEVKHLASLRTKGTVIPVITHKDAKKIKSQLNLDDDYQILAADTATDKPIIIHTDEDEI